MKKQSDSPPPLILTKREVAAQTKQSMSSIDRRVQSGDFPRPVRLGPRRIGWRASDVASWCETLPEAR